MNMSRRGITVLVLAAFSLAPTVASASYPAGVWALVEKVTPEPDDKNPARVRIDGLFMIAKQEPDFAGYPGYSVPAYGYMYYQCAGNDLATCQMEWAELAVVATSEDQCRGWGDSSLPDNGSLRTAEPATKPDTYPLSMGILPGFTPCDALKGWMKENPPMGGSSTGEGTSEGTGEATQGEFDSDSSGGTTAGSASEGPGETTNATTNSPTSEGPNSSGATAGGGSSGSGDTTGNNSDGQADTGTLDDDGKGCVCDVEQERPVGALAPLLGLLALRRRRS